MAGAFLQQSNQLLNSYDYCSCAEPTEPYGGFSVRGLSETKLCERLERSGVQSM